MTLTQTDVYAEWQILCEELKAASDALVKISVPITQKFASIAKGISNNNPTNEELIKLETARKKLDNVLDRMDVFVKKYT